MIEVKNEKQLLNRKETADYVGGTKPLSPGTISVWDCTGRVDLKPIKIKRRVFYDRAHLDFLLGKKDPNDRVLDRLAASIYLKPLKPLSPGTLAVWDCIKRYDLKPIKLGREVRYLQSNLDLILATALHP